MRPFQKICRDCEHYDGGGIDKHGEPRNAQGDCHNGISGRFTTSINESCEKGFHPDSVRWPLRAGPGGMR